MCLIKLVRNLHEKGFHMSGLFPGTGRAPRNGELFLSPTCPLLQLSPLLLGGTHSEDREDFMLAFPTMCSLTSPPLRQCAEIGAVVK